jgi:hypothetical protein
MPDSLDIEMKIKGRKFDLKYLCGFYFYFGVFKGPILSGDAANIREKQGSV